MRTCTHPVFVQFLVLLIALCTSVSAQNIGMNATGALPHPSAMLDISSNNSGFLMPRMTTAERDAIASPALGLQIFNTSTNTVNTYNGTGWTDMVRKKYVLVQSMADLPAPNGTEIKLDGNTLYEVNGTVNISPNYINLNGASLKGGFAEKDLILSNVSGAILRSTDNHVYLEKITMVALSSSTYAYEFTDATADKICVLYPGAAVVDFVTPSLGVGSISGFRMVAILQNYWRCKTGLKIGGNIDRFLLTITHITGITAGSGLEFLPDLNATMLDISSNYFHTTGVPGILNSGSNISIGRLHSNYFSEVNNPISGFSKKDVSWWMSNNTAIADSRVLGQFHLQSALANPSVALNTFQVVAGTYGADPHNERFTQTTDQLNFVSNRSAVVSIVASLSVNALSNSSGEVLEFEIRKNGQSLLESRQKVAMKGQSDFINITLLDITSVEPGDYLEVWGRNTTSTAAWRVERMIMSVR